MAVRAFIAASIFISALAYLALHLSGQEITPHATVITLLPLLPIGAIAFLSSSAVVFSPIFILYLMVLFGNTIRYAVLSTHQELFELRYVLANIRIGEIEVGADYYAYGVISLCVGYLVVSLFQRLTAATRRSAGQVPEHRVSLLVALMVAAIFFGMLVGYLLQTGFLNDLSAKRVLVDDEGTVYRFGAARFVTNIGIIYFQIILVFAALKKDMKYRWLIFAMSLTYILLYSIGLSKRSTLLLSFVPLILVALYRFRFKTLVRLGVSSVAILALTAVITVERRKTVNNDGVIEEVPWTRPFVDLFLSNNFGGLIATAISTDVIADDYPPLYGRTFVIDPVLQFVPRSMWPDKPEELGGRLRQIHQEIGFAPKNYDQGGTAPGLISESWLNFRIPGTIAIMFLYGALCRFVYDRYLARWQFDPMLSAIYLSYLPIFTLNWFGGHTARLVLMSVSFAVAVVITGFVFRKVRHPGTIPGPSGILSS